MKKSRIDKLGRIVIPISYRKNSISQPRQICLWIATIKSSVFYLSKPFVKFVARMSAR